MTVTSMFTQVEHDHGDHVHRFLRLDDGQAEPLAALIAESIVRRNTSGVPDYFDKWVNRRDGGESHPTSVARGLSDLIGMALGLPEREKPKDHVEGLIAEHIWFQLERDGRDPVGPSIHIHPPGLAASDPGADGVALVEADSTELAFRLWEIKKRNPRASLKPVIKKACEQMTEFGFGYLVRVAETLQAQQIPEPHAKFAAQMPELWIEQGRQANAGVAIKAAHGSRKNDSFEKLSELLPGLDGVARRIGVAIESQDFDYLVQRVKEIAWSGL